MKSIIRSKTPKKVLAVNLPIDKEIKLVKILSDLHIELVNCENRCGNEQLGYLLGFSGFSQSDKDINFVSEECIVFSGVDRRELDMVLKAMEKNDIKINLKAVCTAFNQSWALGKLIEELIKEHKAMSGGEANA